MHTATDRRQFPRAAINPQQLNSNASTLELEVNGIKFPVLGSNNISVSGMDIKTPEAIKPSANVRLHFKTQDMHLAIQGQVAWCATPAYQRQCEHDNSDAFAMGIEFDPQSMNDNGLLFLALRHYVDAFE